MAVAAGLSACAGNTAEYEKQMCELLEEKYGEEFQIMEYYGREYVSDSYEVLAVSKLYPEILFEAEAACDGSYLSDEYIASRVSYLVEEQIRENLGGLQGYWEVHTEPISKSIDSNQADMSVQEWMDIKTKNRFVIYLYYSPQVFDAETVYHNFEQLLSGLECLSGTIQFYILEENELQQVQEYLDGHAKLDDTYKKMMDGRFRISIPYEKGVMDITKELFLEKAGEQL